MDLNWPTAGYRICNRRQFLSTSAAAAAFALPSGGAPEDLAVVSAISSNICGYPIIADGRLYATVDEMHRMQDLEQALQSAYDYGYIRGLIQSAAELS